MMKTNKQTFTNAAVALSNDSGDVIVQRIAPYCDAPQRDSAGNEIVQRFNLESAKRLVAAFMANAKKLAGVGNASVPVYRGHPDHVSNKDDFRDSEVYARVENLEAREDGLWATIRKSPLLKKLKNAVGRLEISPRWACAAANDGTYQPEELISLGLVSEGNLPGADVINQKLNKSDTMTEEQIQQLAALLDCEATAEAILAKAEQMKASTETANAETEEAKKQMDEAKAETEEEKKKLEAANAKIASLEAEAKKRAEDLANARNQEAKELLDQAHLAGKITPEQRPALEAFFKADFANAKSHVLSLQAQATESAVAKMQRIADEEGTGKPETFEALANAYYNEQLKAGRKLDLITAINEFSRSRAGMKALGRIK